MTTTNDTLANLAAHWKIQRVGDDHVLVFADGLASATVSIKSGSPLEMLLAALAMELLDEADEAIVAQAPAVGESMSRFCPGCGSVGEIDLTKYRDCCPDGTGARMIPESVARKCHDLFTLALAAACATPQAAQQAAQAPVGWQPIDQAPKGELVVVGWRDETDAEHPDRHDFDYLEDGYWVNHSNNHEHYIMVGGPKLGPGPSEQAPYTHFMRMGSIPASRPQPG